MHYWYELRPFKIEDERNIPNGLQKIMDHIPRFLLVTSKDSSDKVRIHIRISPDYISSLDVLEGIESVHVKEEESKNKKITRHDRYTLLTSHRYYRRYTLKRHCAIPIAEKEATRASIHKILDSDVSRPAYLALHVRKITVAPIIHDYIRNVERGIPPEGISNMLSGIFTLGSSANNTKIPASRVQKINKAKTKMASPHLFICEVFCGANNKDDIKIMENVFPSLSFQGTPIKQKRVIQLAKNRPDIPFLFGRTRQPLLSDTEILSFYGLPENAEIGTVNLKAGIIRSYSSGMRGDNIDFGTLDSPTPSSSPDTQNDTKI